MARFIDRLALTPAVWEVGGLGLYPWPASMIFGGRLHVLARLDKVLCRVNDALAPIEAWEAAYLRFETPEQEIHKFTQRLHAVGAGAWPRDARVLELFCGRGNGLVALERLGFTELQGVDLSPRLVRLYRGRGRCSAGDCRALPIRSASQDVAIVQGGLHHLPDMKADLPVVIGEVQRVLKPGGCSWSSSRGSRGFCGWRTPPARARRAACGGGSTRWPR